MSHTDPLYYTLRFIDGLCPDIKHIFLFKIFEIWILSWCLLFCRMRWRNQAPRRHASRNSLRYCALNRTISTFYLLRQRWISRCRLSQLKKNDWWMQYLLILLLIDGQHLKHIIELKVFVTSVPRSSSAVTSALLQYSCMSFRRC